MALAAGTRLGPYVILAPLGAGGMGEVYRARDSRLERDVAIKVLPEHVARDPDALARFREETKAVAALAHPNILVLHDVGMDHDVCFAVMELLEGETLRARLGRSALPWRKAVELGVALAEGLGAAHAKGIIHRDLKPANIFLSHSGQLKILDFGLARRVTPDPVQVETVAYVPAATEPVSVYGTAPYMSPEQVTGAASDARSDIFSLGCVLYEMVSGRRAFGHKTRPETLAAILKDDPPPLAEASRDVPPDLDRVIRHCLEKNPDDRFQAARDVAFALRALLSGERSPPFTRGRLWRGRARVAGIAVVGLLLATAVALALLWKRDQPPGIETVAVLPFINEGGDASTEYLSDGLADSLIRNLSQVRTLKVRPFSAVLPYKGKAADAAAVGQALKVQAIILGRVSKRGDDLSVSVELVDVADNRQLWGRQYRRKMGNLLTLQEEIAQQIAEGLRLNLSGEEKERLTKRHTENAEAYRDYLLGRYHWNKRTKEGLQRAMDFFQQAIDKDLRFALAYAGLADCYNVLPGYGYTDRPPRESFARAKEMATTALEIDNTLAEAHTALAYERYHVWDWPGAEKEFQRALDANPNYATGHQWYACYLASMGRHEEALAEIRRAQDLDPSSLIINGWVAMILCYGGHVDQALEQGQSAVQMDPRYAVNHFFLGIIYRRKGRLSEAVAEYKNAVDLDRNSTTYLTGLAEAYGASGERKKAQAILDDLAERAKRRYVSPYGVAAIYAALGEKDQAFQWLERAFQGQDDGLANLTIDPSWTALRDDPRFGKLARRLKLPD
jgi:serine/threonine-protein kinase